jgi:hypothetical protein
MYYNAPLLSTNQHKTSNHSPATIHFSNTYVLLADLESLRIHLKVGQFLHDFVQENVLFIAVTTDGEDQSVFGVDQFPLETREFSRVSVLVQGVSKQLHQHVG